MKIISQHEPKVCPHCFDRVDELILAIDGRTVLCKACEQIKTSEVLYKKIEDSVDRAWEINGWFYQ